MYIFEGNRNCPSHALRRAISLTFTNTNNINPKLRYLGRWILTKKKWIFSFLAIQIEKTVIIILQKEWEESFFTF